MYLSRNIWYSCMYSYSTGVLKSRSRKKIQPENLKMDSATFQFHSEDHTLGNALRFMLTKKPEVQFAGYCVPHPSESTMNVRVQCEKESRAETVVDEALQDLTTVFSEISSSFEKAIIDYKRAK